MMNSEIYQLKGIRHYYGDTKVLDIPEMSIKPGTITGILGPNGSGKSTLLKLLAFVQKPSFGQVFYKGQTEHPFSQNVRSKVTLLTQKPYLLKRSVFENVIYGLEIRKELDRLEHRVYKALTRVGLTPEIFAQRMWHELSGGEAQRVALAARLILKPEVLLLDEPIASVDADSAARIREAALEAKKELGTTLVIVSHDKLWLNSISDHQLSIYKGTLFSTGMENVITGPFERSDSGILFKPLSGGQRIYLKEPATEDATALIREKHITLDLKKQTADSLQNQLSGKVTAMMLEKKSGSILVTILCRDLAFVLRLTTSQMTQFSLYPGKDVVLKFSPTDVEWI